MSEELAPLVMASMDVAMLDDLLCEVMARLQAEYPTAKLHGVRLEFTVTARYDQPEERSMHWTLQVDNDRGHGGTMGSAMRQVQEEIDERACVPLAAQQILKVLEAVEPLPLGRYGLRKAADKALDQLEEKQRARER